ncbi:MAG: hypothetical protein HZB14_03920 [Actinobacteria bacterium]|nr:hypothetical protein [Actinomycetota bacterium]
MKQSTLRLLLLSCTIVAALAFSAGPASAAPSYEAKCDVAGTLGPVAGLFNMKMACASQPIGTIACRGNAIPSERTMRGTCASSGIITTRPLSCTYKGGFIIGFNPELWIGDQVSIVCLRSTSPTTIPIVCKLQGGGPINKDQTFTGRLDGYCQYGYGTLE